MSISEFPAKSVPVSSISTRRELGIGTPNSLRPSLKHLIPPRRTVPPSGTDTVVHTLTGSKTGNCTDTGINGCPH